MEVRSQPVTGAIVPLVAPAAQVATTPFTPASIDFELCLARTWAQGSGGQCSRQPVAGNGFCLFHAKDDKWRVHGRVDGPVPEAKLRDFLKASAAAISKADPTSRRLKRNRSKPEDPITSGQIVVDCDEDEAGSSSDDCEFVAPAVLDLARPLRFGSGAVMGAEAVAALARRLGKAVVAPTSAAEPALGSSAPATPPRKPAASRKRGIRPMESDPKDVDFKRLKKSGASKPEKGAIALPVSELKKSAGQVPEAESAQQQAPQQELDSWLERRGVPLRGRMRLAPLLDRWGMARASEVLDLWKFLGDGCTKPVSVPRAHVWGPPGSGKTALLFDFLDTLGIRTVWLNCYLFTLPGEIQAHIVELLRRTAVEASYVAGAPELPRELQNRTSQRQLRSLDKLELAIRPPLDYLAKCMPDGKDVKVVIVLESAHELSRLGANMAELLTTLPELLQQGSRLTVVTESRLPLSSLGLMDPDRDPPAVNFHPYTAEQAQNIIVAELSKMKHPLVEHASQKTIGTDGWNPLHNIGSGLVKFAAPHLGCNLDVLLSIGEELLRQRDEALVSACAAGAGKFTTELQAKIQAAVERRVGLGDLAGFLSSAAFSQHKTAETDPAAISATVALQCMTNGEKRLLVSAYLGSRIQKEDDLQFFLPERLKLRRKGGQVLRRKVEDGLPPFARPPRPLTLARLFAIYHKLADQANVIGAPLFGQLARLRALGLVRILRAMQESDAKVICNAELPLITACAGDLNIKLYDYLAEY